MVTKDFLYGGCAVFTVANPKGEHYTFKVTNSDTDLYFVSVLTGATEYTYIGFLMSKVCPKLYKGKKGMNETSRPVKVFNFARDIILGRRDIPEGYKIIHEGKCGVCGRALTTPESIERGIGPNCYQKIGGL